jgi:hypothetical protein
VIRRGRARHTRFRICFTLDGVAGRLRLPDHTRRQRGDAHHQTPVLGIEVLLPAHGGGKEGAQRVHAFEQQRA